MKNKNETQNMNKPRIGQLLACCVKTSLHIPNLNKCTFHTSYRKRACRQRKKTHETRVFTTKGNPSKKLGAHYYHNKNDHFLFFFFLFFFNPTNQTTVSPVCTLSAHKPTSQRSRGDTRGRSVNWLFS